MSWAQSALMSRRMVWGVTAKCSASPSIETKPRCRVSSRMRRRRGLNTASFFAPSAETACFTCASPRAAAIRLLKRGGGSLYREVSAAFPALPCGIRSSPHAVQHHRLGLLHHASPEHDWEIPDDAFGPSDLSVP